MDTEALPHQVKRSVKFNLIFEKHQTLQDHELCAKHGTMAGDS